MTLRDLIDRLPLDPALLRRVPVPGVSGRVLLELDLDRGAAEAEPSSPVEALRRRNTPTLRALVDGLERGADDEHVVGLVVHAAGARLNGSAADELADAVRAFRATGRPTLAWAETFGELTGGMTPYRVAAACEQVWVQPSGDLALGGIALGVPFVRGTLDRLGVVPQFSARQEFKSAPDTFRREHMSDAARESSEAIVASLVDTFVSRVAADRDLAPEAVHAAIDEGALRPAAALAAGFVDRIGYRDEALAALHARIADGAWPAATDPDADRPDAAAATGLTPESPRPHAPSASTSSPASATSSSATSATPGSSAAPSSPTSAGPSSPTSATSSSATSATSGSSTASTSGGEVSPRYVERYRKGVLDNPAAALRRRRRPVVAVVSAGGPIHLASPQGPQRGRSIHPAHLGAVLRHVGQDEAVKAVVLRIDSPGGSYVASDALRREVLRLRESGTPVVASMASVAASGGYFLAMPCDEIVAGATTLTGSIGVFAGKQVVAAALGRVGVNVDTVSRGRYAEMFSAQREFGDDEWARLDAWLDDVYADFTAKAAHDRGMDLADLEPLARGRVWTGADAAARGLVDTVGGLSAAIERACARGGVRREDVEVKALPKGSPLDMFSTPENSDAVSGASVSLAGDLLAGGLADAGEALLTRAGAHLGLDLPGALTLPPLRVS